MRKDLFILFILLAFSGLLCATVLDFEDLNFEQNISGTNYAGLFWEEGNQGYAGNQGYWRCPAAVSNYPYSGSHNLTNAWGSTLIGIQFPNPVNVIGAYFSGQGSTDSWTTGIRVHGYLNDSEVSTTDWFNDIDTSPDWFAMNLHHVDRIVIESVSVDSGGGWYGMDDLTFVIPEPATLSLLALGAMLVGRKRKM